MKEQDLKIRQKSKLNLLLVLLKKYKLIYAEDAVHEEAFGDMSELVSKFPKTMITGDDLTVTSKDILKKAIENKSCKRCNFKSKSGWESV